MAHILIATSNPKYRTALANVLTAAGHRVVTTSDTALALTALRLSQHRLIAMLGDINRLSTLEGYNTFSFAPDSTATSEHLNEASRRSRHAFILLTKRQPGKLPIGLRMLLGDGQATLLYPNCSIATLLTAVEIAAARLARDSERKQRVEEQAEATERCPAGCG